MSRVVIITGAASGIGLAIATRFLAAGDKVVAADANGPGLEQCQTDNWADFAESILCCQVDVANEHDVTRMVSACRERFGRIDVLVNNAGISGNEEATILHTTPVSEFDRVFDVNVRGIFLTCRSVLPVMLARGQGVIVNIASVAGKVAFPGRCAYSASKGAAVQITRSIATDYAGSGIRCNAVCPGLIQTPMTQWRLDHPDLREALLARIPQKEFGRPEDVADAVLYLAGPEARYFNGAALEMDGGYAAV